MAGYTPQQTLSYSFFIKRALLESLQLAFGGHPSKTVAASRVALDFGRDRWQLPGVIIKLLERELPNAGVGHSEWLVSPQDPDPDNPSLWIQYYHRMYQGDVSFEIYGQSSVDRDLVRDAFIETIAMWDATEAGQNFINRFYNDLTETPYGLWHFPVLMWDKITGYGEQTMIAPWSPEDTLVYQVTYRVPVFGEFYSNTPTLPSSTGVLQEVDVYPWINGLEPTPEENPDTPDNPDWYHFRGWPNESQYI